MDFALDSTDTRAHGQRTVGLLEYLGNKVRLVCVVYGCDWELELVAELEGIGQ